MVDSKNKLWYSFIKEEGGFLKRKTVFILITISVVIILLILSAYFGLRSKLSENRDNGKNIRASAFSEEYNPAEHALEKGFMTTVQKDGSSGAHIFFLHGGGCVMDAVPYHTDVICALADKGLKITAYDYPLFPEAEYPEICDAVYEAYGEFVKMYPEDEIVLYGDSAGGALALHLLMRLRDENAEVIPQKSILVSPMLDLSMTNPEIEKYADGDISLNYNSCKILGFYMAGPRNTKSPEYSPIYGDLNNLGNILMFYGSEEILRPDCEKFAEMIPKTRGTFMEAYMGEKKYHDYVMIVDDKEAVKAFEIMAEFLE